MTHAGSWAEREARTSGVRARSGTASASVPVPSVSARWESMWVCLNPLKWVISSWLPKCQPNRVHHSVHVPEDKEPPVFQTTHKMVLFSGNLWGDLESGMGDNLNWAPKVVKSTNHVTLGFSAFVDSEIRDWHW